MNHIALIFGGPSAEHDVSLFSAKNIFQVLDDTPLKVSLLGVTRKKEWKLLQGEDLVKTDFVNPLDLENVGLSVELFKVENKVFIKGRGSSDEKIGPIEVGFPIIHGPYGEDGELQNELNQLGLPFVGSDFLSCENCFDKAKTKEILKEKKIPQVPYALFEDTNPNFNDLVSQLGLPFFVKPANMGSSIGISKVKSEAELAPALAEARIHDKKIVIEKGVTAREIECALLEVDGELKVTGMGEVKPHHEFYSYEAKYLDPNGADLIIPAAVPEATVQEIQTLAKECFRSLDCRDFARADFFLAPEGQVFFNEINTHPGFTNISQFPKLWEQEGLTYKNLILQLIQNAEKRSR
jgi:D-alanine-D-alanine ligase